MKIQITTTSSWVRLGKFSFTSFDIKPLKLSDLVNVREWTTWATQNLERVPLLAQRDTLRKMTLKRQSRNWITQIEPWKAPHKGLFKCQRMVHLKWREQDPTYLSKSQTKAWAKAGDSKRQTCLVLANMRSRQQALISRQCRLSRNTSSLIRRTKDSPP